jgi:hypothetical protein
MGDRDVTEWARDMLKSNDGSFIRSGDSIVVRMEYEDGEIEFLDCLVRRIAVIRP